MKHARYVSGLSLLVALAACEPPSPVPPTGGAGSCVEGAAESEAGLANRFAELYPAIDDSDNLSKFLTPFRTASWEGGTPPANLYYRTACKIAALGAFRGHRSEDPGFPWGIYTELLRQVAADYFNSSITGPRIPDGYSLKGWGDPASANAWTNGFVGYPCAMATALLWSKVGVDERDLLRTFLRSLAALVTNRSPAWYYGNASIGNSQAEEASGDAAFLALMGAIDPASPSRAWWWERAALLCQYAASDTCQEAEGYCVHSGANAGPDAGSSDFCHAQGCHFPANSECAFLCALRSGDFYENLVANHDIAPHPSYSLSLIMNVARGELAYRLLYQTPVVQLIGSEIFYTLDEIMAELEAGYFAEDSTFTGEYTQASDSDVRGNFGDQSYLGLSGVGDWGMAAHAQNSPFAFLSKQHENDCDHQLHTRYSSLLDTEENNQRHAYFPTHHGDTTCNENPDCSDESWGFQVESGLPKTCATDGRSTAEAAILNPFFTASTATCAQRVNTHLFLNSFTAFEHVVAYLLLEQPADWLATISQ